MIIDEALSSVYDDLESYYISSIQRIREMRQNNEKSFFHGPLSFNSSICTGHGKRPGVYLIKHRDSDEVYYVGQGIVSSRRTVHKRVFLNKGQACIYEKSVVDSHVARKMYEKDPVLDNWFLFYYLCDKDVAKKLEESIIDRGLPQFNSEKMSGVN
jgi:hypothetical protein